MTRVLRILPNAATAVSLVLCVVMAAVRVRRCWRSDRYASARGDMLRTASPPGAACSPCGGGP